VFVTYFFFANIMCVQFATEPPKVQVVEQVVSKQVENHFTRFREGVCVCVNEGRIS
jgi:hypothetical protein